MSTKVESVKPCPKQTNNPSRAFQNYSKILQNFSSNPSSHHRRTGSDFINLNRKVSQDYSIINQSRINLEKKQENPTRYFLKISLTFLEAH